MNTTIAPSEIVLALHIYAYQHLLQGRFAQAQLLLERALEQAPEQSGLRMALAYAALGNGHPGLALDTLDSTGEASRAVAHFLRGKALSQLGRLQEARQEFARYRAMCRNENVPPFPAPEESGA